MDKFARRRLAIAAVAISTTFGGVLVAPGAGATPLHAPAGRDRLPDLVAGHARQLHGRVALQAVGDRLPAAARRNGMAAERLREILSRDPSAWLDQDARLLYADPARTVSGTSSPPSQPAAAAPLSQTFLLHSKADSQRTIYLDFDGQAVSGTVWNAEHRLPADTYPAWSLDANRTTFTDAEQKAIQSVWQRVAEDYAPFDVDVTTEEPVDGDLTRTDSADQVFGVRALISPSQTAVNKLCGGSCGGVAYTGLFDTTYRHAYYQPAWIFPQNLGEDTKSIAEAVSHEVGHTLGLDHDGGGGSAYYGGHGIWAPIMGVGYGKPISQWSKGAYQGATNHEDDLSVIVDHGLRLRPDEEAGNSPSWTTGPPSGKAYITSDSDRDVYRLGICSGSLAVEADPAPLSPNLDIKLSLLGVTGGAVTVANPTSRAGTPSRDVANGMDATLSETVAQDWYFVAVEGVGNGTPSKGYDGYASIGAYTLSVTGNCQSDTTNLPSAPQTVQASTDGRSATVEWSAPASTGGSSITSYVVTRDHAAPVTVGVESRAFTFTGLEPGVTDNVAVQAVNATGEGAPAAVAVKVPATRSAPPRTRSASSGARGGRRTAIARWRAPSSDGGAKLDGYRVYGYRLNASGAVVQTVRSAVRGPSVRSWQPTLSRGRWKFAVIARNAVGWSHLSARSNTVRAR